MWQVLIESDWNLKLDDWYKWYDDHCVLIESDWNLKYTGSSDDVEEVSSINRIRLEFKVVHAFNRQSLFKVLIESDWNLKLERVPTYATFSRY